MDADNTATHVTDLVRVLPRVLIVSRRTIRKNKFVDFVGEYHLDLIVKYGAVPVIVPRVPGVHLLLDSFEPIHGVLLCEGEDIDPSNYNHNDVDFDSLSPQEIEEIRSLHSSDTAIDKAKDSIELHLAKRCLERNIPYLGICRGSQVLNVACGGTLYQDVEKELSKKGGVKVEHINYNNYDNHRHIVKVLQETPLQDWFRESLEPSTMELLVNSYHHQGVKKLADRFKPMAYAPDGLIEAFYDPNTYDPEHGKFIMGLQFHPERMRHMQDDASFDDDTSSEFDYPGCPCAYQEFVKAVLAYQKKLMTPMNNRRSQVGVMKLNSAMEKQRKKLMRSFSMAKLIYEDQNTNNNVMEGADLDTGVEFLEASMMPLKMSELENEKRLKQMGADLDTGVEFLEARVMPLKMSELENEKRLKQMGATVRNSSSYKERVLKCESVEALLKELPTHQLLDLLDVYKTVVHVGTQVIHDRLQNNINVSPTEHIDLPN